MKQMLPAPANTRQMLLAFAFYDQVRGLPSLLGRFDFSGVTRRQIYYGVLGRGPENAQLAVDGPDYRPRGHMRRALESDEFQSRIREIVLAAFPEKRRLIFVHIAKCAGSDLLMTLERRYPFLHHHLALAPITSKADLFGVLQGFAMGIGLSDSIAISGHVPLRWYTERRLVRFEDALFATVRHPRELLYSYISFILTRLVNFQGTPRHDTSEWLSHIGMTEIAPDPSAAYLAELGGRLLRAPAVTMPNMLCECLGAGKAASAFEAIVTTDIELTDTSRYSAWRRARFDYEPEGRVNPSQPLFTPEIASAADRAVIEALTGEDMTLYERIREGLETAGTLSIRGRELRGCL